jgi:hypothetical protein
MELTRFDKAIIVTIFIRSGRSKTAHFPLEFIHKGFPSHLRGKIKKRVIKLKRAGYIYVKPHPSGVSYGLTDAGWKLAKKLEEDAGKKADVT